MLKKKKFQPTYSCPFCKKDIVASQKTEIHYRNCWVDGCTTCFMLSINKATATDFQHKEYMVSR